MASPSLTDESPIIISSREWSGISDSINALHCALFKCGDCDETEKLDIIGSAYVRLSQTVAPINERLSDQLAEGGAE